MYIPADVGSAIIELVNLARRPRAVPPSSGSTRRSLRRWPINIKARFAALGGTVFALSPDEFGKLLADETAKWGKVVRAANIRLE